MPKRIQRKRTKGWRMPAGAVYVGRPTKWGNPFRFCWWLPADAKRGLAAYREWVVAQIEGRFAETSRIADVYAPPSGVAAGDLNKLRGKDLACWCQLEDEHGKRWPCHADVLLELANA